LIDLDTPIYANVSVENYCNVPGICNRTTTNIEAILGGGVPSRTFPLIDSDGVVRYYPQAVVRQMTFPPNQKPQCAPGDMMLIFNSEANFFYYSSNETIGSDQYDFLTVAIHEYTPSPLQGKYGVLTGDRIVHGLGFRSLWQNWLNIDGSLVPNVAIGNPTSQNGIQYEGFVESAFDRMLALTNYPGITGSNLTVEMNNVFGWQGHTFPNSTVLAETFANSPAVAYSEYMNGNSTERDAIYALLPLTSPSTSTLQTNYSLGGPVTLETSFSDFADGSSLCHVDAAKYLSTQDFLMRYETAPGQTLENFVAAYGVSGDSNYGAFGPGLRYILGGLGYRVRGGIPLGGSVVNSQSDVGEQDGGTGSTGSGSTTKSAAGGRVEIGWWAVGVCIWMSVYWTFWI
jgi:hypothetical protein